jgi:hypothetical protein
MLLGQKSEEFSSLLFTSTNEFYPPPPLEKKCLKLVFNVNIVYGYLKSENFQDYSQKPQQNCMFMNLATGKLNMV